jgi:hypothetical protein
MAGKDERRRFPRVRLDGRLTGRATVLADFKVITLSESGATLAMAIPMALGAKCDITLHLSHVSVDLYGSVVRIDKPSDSTNGAYVVCVDFMRLQALDRALLASFLERERRKAL